MTVHVRTEEFKPNRTALPRSLVRRRPVCRSHPKQIALNEVETEMLFDLDYVEIDGIRVLNTAAALTEHAKNMATPHRFEIGDLVDLHFTNRGHFDAIVLDRHLFAPGANGGRAVTLLYVDEGAHIMTISERYLELLERGYWSEEEAALYQAWARPRARR
ncbi:hypothetical protein [Sinorhizobium meliloti]|uniref:hypothetical protein n=1 Tax=Rhizobium meliloti TaxID=382 RepID=UPI000FDCD95D|nr:hypothetical protein [Sinorhizobium meliloti]RVH15319.1 hypothetical protein CN215_34575 [Sinorhizobium meliloti]